MPICVLLLLDGSLFPRLCKITCIVFFWALIAYSLADDCNLFVGSHCIILQGMKHDVVVKGDCTISLSRRPHCELVRFFFFFCCGAATQRGSWPPHSWGFLDHTQRRTTVGRTLLDEWSARRRDLYLTTHNTQNRQTSMPPVGFEPTISAGERPQTYALDRATTGIGELVPLVMSKRIIIFVNYESNQQGAIIQVNLLFLVSSSCFGQCFRPTPGALDCIYSIW